MQSRTRRPPARHSPRSCPNRVSGGLLPSRGAPSSPAVAAVTHPPLVPGTGHIVHRIALPNCRGMLQGPPRVAASLLPPPHCTSPALGQPAPLGMLRGTQPSRMLHLLVLRGAQGWADLRTSPNSSWKASAKPESKLGTSHSQCFFSCSTHARHAHRYFNVSWMHVAALHEPSRTRAPPWPQATVLPAQGLS